jgi:hypothetical protein
MNVITETRFVHIEWDVYPILVKRQYDFAMRIVGIIFAVL